MPSNNGPVNPGFGDLPPELDPRRGRPGHSGSGPALPPELDPRGRRVARAEATRRAAGHSPTEPRITRAQRRAAARGGSDVLHGAALGMRLVAAVLSLLVLLGSGWAWATYRTFSADIKRVNAITKDPGAKNIDGKDLNILIVGNDDRETASDAELSELGTTRDGGSLNTDTMMLMHVPANGSKATAISFPRDSYVDIPGHGKNKLNAAYTEGVQAANGDRNSGARLLVQTIEGMTGLTIDHFVQVDLIGFYRISNAVGGIDVCLNAAQQDDFSQINLPAGHSVIKGKQALAFVRQRHGLPGGDLDRIKRQQYFLSAVFRKMSSGGVLLNPLKLQPLLKAVSSSLTMDPGLDPLKLARQMQNLQAGNFSFTTIPTKGFQDTSVGNVVVVDAATMPDFIDGLIGTDAASALAAAKDAPASSFAVDVWNGSGVNMRATRNAEALRALGFTANVPQGDPDQLTATTIRYAPGMEGAAKTLAAQIPGAKIVRSRAVHNLTLILGANGVQVKSLMPVASPTPRTSATPSQSSSSTPPVTTAAAAGCIN